MLDGVTILNTVTHTVVTKGFGLVTWSWIWLGVLLTSIFVILLLAKTYDTRSWDDGTEYIIPVLMGVFSVIAFLAVSIDSQIKTSYEYNTYDVIIDDTVNLNEFTSRYKIIEQNGLIYTIEEIREDT